MSVDGCHVRVKDEPVFDEIASFSGIDGGSSSTVVFTTTSLLGSDKFLAKSNALTVYLYSVFGASHWSIYCVVLVVPILIPFLYM